MKNILIFLFVIFLISACEKNIDIKIPDEGRRLVLNGLLGADSILSVNLTISKYILDSDEKTKPVEGAKVVLYKDNQLIEILTDSSAGYYYANYTLKQGENYHIKVETDNYPDLETETTVPYKTNIIELDAYQTFNAYDWPETRFTLIFKDNPEYDNYYAVSVIERRYTTYELGDGEDTVLVDDYHLNIYSSDPNVFSDDWYLQQDLLFTDELIQGKEYKLQFNAQRNFYDNNNTVSVYYVQFKTISKDYYLYYTSLAKHYNAQDEFFMEPVQVYTNIKNGFGIFAVYAADVDSVRLESITRTY